MKQHFLFAALFAMHIGCQSPKVSSRTAAVEDDRDLSIRICGYFQAAANQTGLDCGTTPATVYSAITTRRTNECRGNSTCLVSPIHLYINIPIPPVPASYMQQYITAAHQIETFMATKDLRGYQLTLEQLAWGAKQIGTSMTEVLRRNFESGLKRATKDRITNLGSAAFGAEQARAVRTRDAIQIVRNINDRYTPIVNQLAVRFVALVTLYQALRSVETTAIDDLTAAVNEASQADTDGAAAALIHVVDVARGESGQTNAFAVEASRFRAELAAMASQYSDEIAPHRELMQELGLPALEFSTRSDVSVDSMISYAEQRDTRIADVAERLVVQIRLRLHALQAAAASEGVRQALADAALLKASTEFLATSNARIAEILRTPEKSPVLRISILSPMQRDMVAFLQFEPPCLARGATNPWMNTGCNVLAPNFSKARQFLNTRLPATIRLDAGTFRRNNAPAELVAAMDQQLAAGNLEAACRTHDDLIGIAESNAGGAP